VEAVDEETGEITGRADHQAPETDGQVRLEPAEGAAAGWAPRPGVFVTAEVIAAEGVDLVARALPERTVSPDPEPAVLLEGAAR
jgi:hypothetical protein